MPLAEIEALAARSYARLPAHFRAFMRGPGHPGGGFPHAGGARKHGQPAAYDLLGLFQGIGLPFRQEATGTMPNMIWLYRRPILAYWTEHEESLAAIVTHVLVHEIGHHFGLSDDDMEAIEAGAG